MPVELRPEKMWVNCPHCRQRVETDLHVLPGPVAYFFGVVISLLGGVLGCCLIPCCIEECMDVHHTCPNCRGYLGKFRHFCS
ncbi:Hypothetical predicted protein [Cloeon dipterum]|uniref:LITAF domain-containing protein n=1 Tax=Cloeon dipterum TaxID=197152 RepID=A0A8S1CM71_9INSE|nr:Hypothetical predicted protein [Cloeon dipterum]